LFSVAHAQTIKPGAVSSVEDSKAIMALAETLDILSEASGAFRIESGTVRIEGNPCSNSETTVNTTAAVSRFSEIISDILSYNDADELKENKSNLTKAQKDLNVILEGDDVKICESSSSVKYYDNEYTTFFNMKSGYTFLVLVSREN
jgi:hypothetical protein